MRAAPVNYFLFVAVAAFPESVAVGFASDELPERVGAVHVCVACRRGVDALCGRECGSEGFATRAFGFISKCGKRMKDARSHCGW
jgi:hypothetical protein